MELWLDWARVGSSSTWESQPAAGRAPNFLAARRIAPPVIDQPRAACLNPLLAPATVSFHQESLRPPPRSRKPPPHSRIARLLVRVEQSLSPWQTKSARKSSFPVHRVAMGAGCSRRIATPGPTTLGMPNFARTVFRSEDKLMSSAATQGPGRVGRRARAICARRCGQAEGLARAEGAAGQVQCGSGRAMGCLLRSKQR